MKPPMQQAVLAVLLIFIFSFSGCSSIPYASSSNKLVTANPTPEGYQFVQHISESNYQFHLFWGIVPIKAEGQEGVFKKYIDNGDGITNVRTEQQWDIISWLASSFSYGIVHLTHTEFQGDLVKKT